MALALRKEEGLGLGIAIAAHAALVAVLLLRPHSAPVVKPPERIEVTISDEVGLTSTSPQPNSQAAPPIAPTLGEPQPQEQAEPAESEPEAEPAPPEPAPPPPKPAPPKPAPPKPEPVPPRPRPTPKVEQPAPRPVPKPTRPAPERPAPKPRETARPTPPKPAPKAPAAKPAPKPPAKSAPAKSAPARSAPAKPSAARAPAKTGTAKSPPAKTATKSNAPAGGSRIGSDFLAGVSGATSNNRASTAAPAATIGPAVKASLSSAISRQLKPKWQAPQGLDAEDLITVVAFSLNKDGSLSGTPTVVRQLGINANNRPQAERHAEQAIRAVRLAAPFDLPAEYYSAWKRAQFQFDKRLSQ